MKRQTYRNTLKRIYHTESRPPSIDVTMGEISFAVDIFKALYEQDKAVWSRAIKMLHEESGVRYQKRVQASDGTLI